MSQQFAGASKINNSLLASLEQRVFGRAVPQVPAWLETHHLTLFSVIWCKGIIAFSYLATTDLRWLSGVSLMIVLQYVTDFLDGKVGKLRGTGLVRWGYYMDHFLDYVFLCSVAVGYAIILPVAARFQMLLVLAVFGAYMVHSFLLFAATDKFEISTFRMGPTEFRLALVIINTLLIFYGTHAMIKALPFVAGGALISLCLLVYRTQRKLWRLDLAAKNNKI